ncbi:hypothetical protein PQX77_013199 [Marasmius sp. AFHP31]|nr:hypothetical protein PQX77_013199 [Marasmius sp. AFHP31]
MASNSLEEKLAPYLTVRNVIVSPIATLSSMFLVYGMYTIIFGLCIHVLFHRKGPRLTLYLICTITLFVLATLTVASKAFGLTRQSVIHFRALRTRDFGPVVKYLAHDNAKFASAISGNISSTFMAALADLMLIHRCYVIWGSSKIMMYTLAFMAVTIHGIALASNIMSAVGLSDIAMRDVHLMGVRIDNGDLIAVAVFNGILSLLTGGRIWWISRAARQQMGAKFHARYKDIVVAILESGVLFPATLITSMVIPVVVDPDSRGLVPVNLATISALMSGLAPTLIIVRVAHGKSVESVQQMVESIHFAEQSHQGGGPGTSVLRTTVDIRPQPQNENLRENINAEKQKEQVNETRLV